MPAPTYYVTVMTITSASLVCFPGDTHILTSEGSKKLKNLLKGDLVLTKRGFKPVAKLIRTVNNLQDRYEYINIPKNIFGSVPTEDMKISSFHPFSLGYEGDDDEISIWFVSHFLENIDGIERIYTTDIYYNIAFDDIEEISIYGMNVFSHHPKGEPHILEKEEYFDPENYIKTKDRKFREVEWDEFITFKEENESIYEFIERKLSFKKKN